MKREDLVEYDIVPDHQLRIHGLLIQWARWVKPRSHGWHVSPMFKQYRSKAWQWHEPVVQSPINVPEALEMEKAVSLLPEKERAAIRWYYYYSSQVPSQKARADGYEVTPPGMARILGVSKQGLADLVRIGRTMLMNRGV